MGLEPLGAPLHEFVTALELQGCARLLVTNGVERCLIVDPERSADVLAHARDRALRVESMSRLTAHVSTGEEPGLTMGLACIAGEHVAAAVAELLVDLAMTGPGDESPEDALGTASAPYQVLRAVTGVTLTAGALQPARTGAAVDRDAWPHLGVVQALFDDLPGRLEVGEFGDVPPPPTQPLTATLARLLGDASDWRIMLRPGRALPLRSTVSQAVQHAGLLATAVALENGQSARVQLASQRARASRPPVTRLT